MAAWAFVLGGFLSLSLVILITLALAFSYQHLHCTGDKRIICWADWTCAENGGTNVLREYFTAYSNKCLFDSTPEKCNCGSNGNPQAPPLGDASDLGYHATVVAGAGANNSQTNPYSTTGDMVKPYNAAGYTDNGTYNNSNQNICGNAYPVPVASNPPSNS